MTSTSTQAIHWLLGAVLALAAPTSVAQARDYCPDLNASQVEALLLTRVEGGSPIGKSSDGSVCHLFLATALPGESAVTARGVGASASEALDDALSRLPTSPSAAHVMQVDFVRRAWMGAERPPGVLEAGQWGIASDLALSQALTPAAIKRRRLIDSDGDFRPDRIDRYETNADLPPGASAWPVRFETETWSRAQGKVTRRPRGNPPAEPVDPARLEMAAREAADYLAQATDPDGFMVYDYRPWLERSDRDYNILRHAGSIFSLLQAARHFDEPRYRSAARRALDWLEQRLKPCPGLPDALCVVERSAIKLGGNGLALLAVTEWVALTGDRERLATAERLARWLVAAQREDGAFRPHKWSWPDGAADDFISGYYPGEAMLGLVRLHELDGNPQWLETAVRAGRWLREGRDADRADQELPHDHWQLYALARLRGLRPDPEEAAHGLRIASAILDAQNRHPAALGEPSDWQGSFYRPPRTTPTATRAEALLGAWVLAHGDADFRGRLFDGLCRSIGFTLRTRFDATKSMLVGEPGRVRGGYHRSLTDWGIRIDYVQHNLSALVGFLDILRQEGRRCR